MGGGDKKSWRKDKRMSVGVQGIFRLLHYDFSGFYLFQQKLWKMSHCNLWFSAVMAQCLYLPGSRSHVVRTCLVSFRRQGASYSHLNFICSGICWNIWWWLVLETLQWMCWETSLAQDESFSAPLCCTALGNLEVLHALTFRKLKYSLQGCH